MRNVRRPLIAICAAAMLLPLAACYDDGYGPNQGYGPPPPPPPPQGRDGYYRDAPPPQGGQGGYYDDRGGPPPQQGGDPRGYYDDRGAPPPPPQGQSNYPYRQAPPPADARGGYDQGQPYYPEHDYRPEPGQERALSRNDEVYRGQDGQYYCKRNDGTTGLIIGALAGGLLGNVIDGGRHRTLGTLLGAGGGAVAGQAVDQGQVRCK